MFFNGLKVWFSVFMCTVFNRHKPTDGVGGEINDVFYSNCQYCGRTIARDWLGRWSYSCETFISLAGDGIGYEEKHTAIRVFYQGQVYDVPFSEVERLAEKGREHDVAFKSGKTLNIIKVNEALQFSVHDSTVDDVVALLQDYGYEGEFRGGGIA